MISEDMKLTPEEVKQLVGERRRMFIEKFGRSPNEDELTGFVLGYAMGYNDATKTAIGVVIEALKNGDNNV